MKKNISMLNKVRSATVAKKMVAYLLSFIIVFQNALFATASAASLSDGVIQSDFSQNPIIEGLSGDSSYLYESNDFLESSAPRANDLEKFYETVFSNHKAILGEPTYVPVGVGGVTVVLPIHEEPVYVGTSLIQSRYIRYQIQQLLGRNLIDADSDAFADEVAQLNSLYEGAINYIQYQNNNVAFGEPLGYDQENSESSYDMVWPEYRVINGKKVLVPIVYLTSNTVASHRVTDHKPTYNGTVYLLEFRVS